MTGHKGAILAVDDESDSLRLLTDVLAEEGYQVRPANSGQLALASIAAECPELILLDVRMPGMDGFEVCRRVKQFEKGSRIPLIFASASTNAEERVEGFSLGAVDFITKPFQRNELLARVRTHLELGRLRERLEVDVARRTVELSESEERFRTMADAAPVLIWAAGTDKLCTFFNRGWLEFSGRSLTQELGDGWVEGVHPDDVEHCCTTYSVEFEARREFQMQYRLRRADGEYRWVLDRGAPRFSDGIFLGYVGSCIDISDFKRTQEEALSRQKLESMGLMAGGIAHDFNNLLGTMLGSVDIAVTELSEGESCEEELQRIRTTAIRGAELIRELMIYAGRENPALESVDFAALIAEMLQLLKVAVSKKVALRLELGENLPPIYASSSQIRQLLMNLIINAADAIGDAVGEIVISARAAKIAGRNHLRLQISDTGSGIPPDVQIRIFDPFFSTKAAGRGLGLAVVQGIVRTHGGTIAVASEPGEGTIFEILMPCAASAKGTLSLQQDPNLPHQDALQPAIHNMARAKSC